MTMWRVDLIIYADVDVEAESENEALGAAASSIRGFETVDWEVVGAREV